MSSNRLLRDALIVNRTVDQVMKGFKRELRGALFEAGDIIVKRSTELVPKDTLALMRSVFREVDTTSDPDQVLLVIGYDRDQSLPRQYAIIVHEDLRARHDDPTQAKFLERALTEKTPEFMAKVAAISRRSLLRKR